MVGQLVLEDCARFGSGSGSFFLKGGAVFEIMVVVAVWFGGDDFFLVL